MHTSLYLFCFFSLPLSVYQRIALGLGNGFYVLHVSLRGSDFFFFHVSCCRHIVPPRRFVSSFDFVHQSNNVIN